MCGVIALISTKRRLDRDRVERALDALGRRGPDGRGVFLESRDDVNVILGHTRLAIVDAERGAQPIANEDETRVLAFNGEIYGHAELRVELEAKGHRFKSRCDAEIALHLYEELGPAMLSRLRGEYAFVIWNARDRVLFAARDRFGVKPLVYAEHDGITYVGSQAKALFAAGFPARWDDASFFQAASLQYTLPDATLFEGVHVIPPGHYLLLHDGHLRIRRYWDLDYPTQNALQSNGQSDQRAQDFETAASALRSELSDAVRVRLRADVPVAFQLSGGIDSSAVLALGASMLDRPADAFTVSFDDARYDERPIAEEMAKHVGARLRIISTNREQLVQELPRAIADGEGLAVNAHIAAKHVLSRAIRDAGFKVVLTGEGADEVLAGYAHLRLDLDQRRAVKLAGDNVVSTGLMLPDGGGDAQLDTSAIGRAIGFVPTWLRAKASLGHRVRALLREDWVARWTTHCSFADRDPFAMLLAHVDVGGQLEGRGRVEQALYLWSKLALEGYILRTLGDGMEMAHSVEGRLPFLDHRVFELVRTFPTHFKINADGVEKAVLRAAVGPLLTERLRSRPKHPFLAPPSLANADGSIPPLVMDLLRGGHGAPFFDRTKVDALLDRLPAMSAEERIATEPALMIALSVAVLHAHFHL
jgi:asparagine synthase (glutamine-hydrolysing)